MAEKKSNQDEILSNWEAVFKRGLLSFWILLLLSDHASYPYEMNNEIQELSKGTMSADGNSLYRALRRFEELGLVESRLRNSETGPDRRYYRLTTDGEEILAKFIERNILVFKEQSIVEKIENVLKYTGETA